MKYIMKCILGLVDNMQHATCKKKQAQASNRLQEARNKEYATMHRSDTTYLLRILDHESCYYNCNGSQSHARYKSHHSHMGLDDKNLR